MQQQQLDQMQAAGGGVLGAIIGLIYLVVIVLTIVGLWKVFTKAAEPGWAAIVPIYNLVVLVKISGKPLWWVLLCLVPCVNFVALIIIGMAVAKNFGRSEGFGIGLGLLAPIFYPVLGFSDSQYIGQKTA